jgi:3-oxoadipate enol-lactonase
MNASLLGSSIFFEIVGEGHPLVFVHGLGGTGNVWHAQRHVLQKTHRVVTLDLPGSGRSGKTETTFSMDRWADQIVGLADHLQFDRFTLVGHSMSTILAQKAAGKYPERIASLILCGPMTELAAAGKEAFAKRKELVQNDGMIAVADLVLAGALSPATREGNAPLAGMFRELLMSNDPKCYAAQCQALLDGSAKADQTSIRCPTLILVGDQDTVTPLANARAITAAVPSARIRIVPATAHLTMAERPELFNALVLEFLVRKRIV